MLPSRGCHVVEALCEFPKHVEIHWTQTKKIDTDGFGLKATSHYLGPTLAFSIPRGPTVTFSPNFGLNDNSMGVIYRIKVAYEIPQIAGWFHRR